MYYGILAAVISALFSTSKDVVSKKVSFNVHASVSAFASFVFALPYYLALLGVLYLLGGENFEFGPNFLLFVLLRSITDTAAELCKMHALSCADLSLIVPIFALYPLFLLATSPFITGDPLPAQGIVGIVLIVAGSIILVARPAGTFDRTQLKGIGFALVSSVCFALNSCFDRLAAQSGSAVLGGFAMTLFSAVFLIPFLMRVPQPAAALIAHQRPFFVRGFFEVGFMTCKLYALKFLTAPYVVGIQKISLLLSILSGKLIFKEKDFARRILAGAFVLAGIITIVFL